MTHTAPAHPLDELDQGYARRHTAKEDAFWRAKMGLADDTRAAHEELERREVELQRFLQAPEQLAHARELLAQARTETECERARGWVRTFEAHVIDSAAARELAEQITAAEARLEHARGEMELGRREASGEFVRASSVKLSSLLRSSPDESTRRAAWEGLRSIEPFVIHAGFLELVRQRNRLGRMLGAEDYYDWKTRRVEGLSKAQVFAWLDDLELRTRDAAQRAIARAREQHGAALTPWNFSWLVAGDVTRELDPYFPFRAALERWGRSFAAMGVRYRGAQLVLDLVDRRGKYENGFMHGPVVAWRRAGELIPARIHFTANAIPGMVGSGQRAMATLFHEGGHAAHFANIDMPSPCFGQEFAPTSVAFSETQSMFFDSLLDDADWQSRYALDVDGRPAPLELIERAIDAQQPFAAWNVRSMLAVCYGEKALYELGDDALTPANALRVLREVERKLLFLDEGAPRPILAVPHLLSGDSSAYYHGYVLAEMAVHQTREHFLARDGHLVDNPRIGPEFAAHWWGPGNSVSFGEFVRRLTGAELSASAMAQSVNRSATKAREQARASIARLAQVAPHTGAIELEARITVAHGREKVAELRGDFDAFSADFARWIDGQSAAS